MKYTLQEYRETFNALEEAIINLADIICELNKIAHKNPFGQVDQKRLFEIKKHFTIFLYSSGFTRKIRRVQRVPCKRCKMDGCFACNGTGYYQLNREVLEFEFEVCSYHFGWHLPPEEANWLKEQDIENKMFPRGRRPTASGGFPWKFRANSQLAALLQAQSWRPPEV